MEMVLRGLWGKIPLDLCSLRFTVIYGPGRETTFTVEEIVGAALAGKTARIAPMTDWPYVYIDDAAARGRPGLLLERPRSSSAISSRIQRKSRLTTSPLPRRPPASRCASRSTAASRRPSAARSMSSQPRATSGFARKSVIAREFAV